MMDPQGTKAAGAFRTIGEVSAELGIAQHVLRFWETRFRQLRPVQRAGNRRYYRPEDVALVARIDQLLNQDGLTIKGVQRVLARETKGEAAASREAAAGPAGGGLPPATRTALETIRMLLADGLAHAR
jgi:DNA-binding transcriptional MerR regulator